jgi:hypothetical protein
MELNDISGVRVLDESVGTFWYEKRLPLKVQKLYLNFCYYNDAIDIMRYIRPTDELKIFLKPENFQESRSFWNSAPV